MGRDEEIIGRVCEGCDCDNEPSWLTFTGFSREFFFLVPVGTVTAARHAGVDRWVHWPQQFVWPGRHVGGATRGSQGACLHGWDMSQAQPFQCRRIEKITLIDHELMRLSFRGWTTFCSSAQCPFQQRLSPTLLLSHTPPSASRCCLRKYLVWNRVMLPNIASDSEYYDTMHPLCGGTWSKRARHLSQVWKPGERVEIEVQVHRQRAIRTRRGNPTRRCCEFVETVRPGPFFLMT